MTEQETQESKLTADGKPVLPVQLCQALRSFACESKQQAREQCGLMCINQDGEWSIMEIPNVAPASSEFKMAEAELLQAWQVYKDEIVGCWHTHWSDDPNASNMDLSYAVPHLRYWIATVHGVFEYRMGDEAVLVHTWKHVGG